MAGAGGTIGGVNPPRVVPVETLRTRLAPICRPPDRTESPPQCRSFIPNRQRPSQAWADGSARRHRSRGTMNSRAWVWAFLGLPGLREVVLVALVTLLLYGRSGLQIARRGRGLGLHPWLSPVRRTSSAATRAEARAHASSAGPGSSRRGDRVFWFLAIVAATAV